MRVLQGDRAVMQQVRHRRFHPDEEFVEGDGLDPSLEIHACLVCFAGQVRLVGFSPDEPNTLNELHTRVSPSERNTR
jgi:hypothetical protein